MMDGLESEVFVWNETEDSLPLEPSNTDDKL